MTRHFYAADYGARLQETPQKNSEAAGEAFAEARKVGGVVHLPSGTYATSIPTFKEWKENNLCGVCPYRKALQDKVARMEVKFDELVNDYNTLKEERDLLVLLSKPLS